MAAKWIETITGSLEQKKQYKQAVARIEALPQPYRDSAQALHRYFLVQGGIVDGDTLTAMFNDFVDLWERAAADGTPIRDIVGDDPAGFADEFAAAYTGKRWIDKERKRLNASIAKAEEEEKKS